MAGIALNWDPEQFETEKSQRSRMESVDAHPGADDEEALESPPA